jgi:hypothetical protein
MAHEHVKQLLHRAATEDERAEAIRQAILAGMPLSEIEAYLDWLDAAGGRSLGRNAEMPGGTESSGGDQGSPSGD